MNFQQITEMIVSGMTPEQIADTLQLPLEEIQKIINNNYQEENNLDALYAKYQIDAVKTLNRVMKDSENDSARVSAAKVILSRGGNFTEEIMDRLSERFKRMREVCKKHTTTVTYEATVTSDSSNDSKVALNLDNN